MQLLFKASAASLTLFGACMAWAQAPANPEEAPGQAAQEGGSLGLSVMSRQSWFGDDHNQATAMPSFEYHWANGWVLDTGRGLGYNFSRRPDLQYGVGLGVDLGRKADSNSRLAGMGDIDAKAVAGLFVSYEPVRDLRLSSNLRYGAGDSGDGVVANFGVDYGIALAPRWRLGLGANANWANASYMQSWYGVSATQSAKTGYSEYAPTAGFSDLTSTVKLDYQLSPQTTISGQLSASKLVGDAGNSPLVTRTNSTSAGVSVRWAF